MQITFNKNPRKSQPPPHQSLMRKVNITAKDPIRNKPISPQEISGRKPSVSAFEPQFSDIQNMKQRLDKLMKTTQFIIQKQTIPFDSGKSFGKKNDHTKSEKKLERVKELVDRPISIHMNHNESKKKLASSSSKERNLSKKNSNNFYNQNVKEDQNGRMIVMKKKETQQRLGGKKINKESTKSVHNITTQLPLLTTKTQKTLYSEPQFQTTKKPKQIKKQMNLSYEPQSTQVETENKTSSQELKSEEQISWTKYISLELKCQNLQNQLRILEKQGQLKQQSLLKQIEQKQAMIKHINKRFYEQKNEWEQKYNKMNSSYEDKLREKNQHIRQLVEELSGQTMSDKQAIFKKNIHQIMENDQQLQLQLSEKQKRIFELQMEFKVVSENNQHLTTRYQIHKEEINKLNLQINQMTKIMKQNHVFDEMLKVQLDEMEKNKSKIELLEQENTRLRQKLINTEREQENLSNELRILQLKESSTKNRLTTEFGIKLHEKDNMITTLQKKMHTLEEKYKIAGKEIKQKDEFLKQYLIGRTDEINIQEYVCQVLEKYKENFSTENKLQDMEEQRKKLELKLKYYQRNW